MALLQVHVVLLFVSGKCLVSPNGGSEMVPFNVTETYNKGSKLSHLTISRLYIDDYSRK